LRGVTAFVVEVGHLMHQRLDSVAPDQLEEAIKTVDEIGTLPHVMARILAIVDDDNSTALDLATEIEQDQALTSSLLRLVNSAYYGFQRQIMTVSEAVVILGFAEVERLSLAISVINTLGMNRDRVRALSSLWKHSLAASIVGSYLENQESPSGSHVSGAHVAGLLHGLGLAALAQHFPSMLARILRLISEEEHSLIEAEREVLEGLTHCDLGGWLVERWNLPTELAFAIRYHRTPDIAETMPKLLAATHLSDHVAVALGFPCLPGDETPPLHPTAGSVFGWDDERTLQFRSYIERNRNVLGAVASGAMF